jgi:hypothetical protein
MASHQQKGFAMSEEQLDFAIYCIGNLSRRLNIPQPQIYNMLNDSGILQGYIVECYDVLHTFGKEYLMEDLIGYMREKGLVL